MKNLAVQHNETLQLKLENIIVIAGVQSNFVSKKTIFLNTPHINKENKRNEAKLANI